MNTIESKREIESKRTIGFKKVVERRPRCHRSFCFRSSDIIISIGAFRNLQKLLLRSHVVLGINKLFSIMALSCNVVHRERIYRTDAWPQSGHRAG